MNNACRLFSNRPHLSTKTNSSFFYFQKAQPSPRGAGRCSVGERELRKAFHYLWTQPSELRTAGRENLCRARTSRAPEGGAEAEVSNATELHPTTRCKTGPYLSGDKSAIFIVNELQQEETKSDICFSSTCLENFTNNLLLEEMIKRI